MHDSKALCFSGLTSRGNNNHVQQKSYCPNMAQKQPKQYILTKTTNERQPIPYRRKPN